MDGSSASGITVLLRAWGDGDDHALERLTFLVYENLDRLAHFYMARERSGHILQDTALINETYLRLANLREIDWKDRKHFYVVCARLMQRILTEYARSGLCRKRGGDAERIPFDERLFLVQGRRTDLVGLGDALDDLARVDERKARVVELRFFAGLSVDETAEVLEVSERTVNEDWKFAKSWLLRELDRSNGNGK
jgi:RNA polymerase sigma-70 factor, ECF subfamily